MNIASNLERAVRHFPDRPAIIFGDRTLTYRELDAAVNRAAHGLLALHVAAGDRVALFLPNIPEFPIVYLAAQKLGAIAVSVNAMLTTEELRHILQDSGASAVFTTEALWPQVQPLVGALPELRHVITCEGEVSGHQTLSGLCEGQAEAFRARDFDRATPAAILYTSGTTGKEKGATLSHGNIVSNMYSVQHCLRTDPTDRLVLFLPLFHCFGQNFIMNAAFNAGAAIILHRRFHLQNVLASIEQHRATMFFAVPTIYIGLLTAGVAPERLASIRFYFSAAATLPTEVAGKWRARYGAVIHEGYGLTETSPLASFNHEIAHRPGSVGAPIENVEMKVLDENGDEVPAGTWGEIAIRGPNVMLGYWKRPRDTAQALRDGWFRSGDIAYVDDDGYFHLVDRRKDMINSAGFKIWPNEVEEVLYQHPAVQECAVIGAPDAVKGEVVKAFVALRPEARLTAEEVEAFCRQHMASYKVPRLVQFIAEIPKSPAGKTLKRVLREKFSTPE
jgi:long-chain acyl-CoA synthetase